VTLLVEVAPGELIDKITILEIKLQNIEDEAKLANVRREHAHLMETFRANIPETPELRELIDELRAANQKIWDIEDEIRELERNKDFGDAFVAVARSVYRSNDARAATKRKINELLDSVIIEEKSYAEY
jgi:arginine deiminase